MFWFILVFFGLGSAESVNLFAMCNSSTKIIIYTNNSTKVSAVTNPNKTRTNNTTLANRTYTTYNMTLGNTNDTTVIIPHIFNIKKELSNINNSTENIINLANSTKFTNKINITDNTTLTNLNNTINIKPNKANMTKITNRINITVNIPNRTKSTTPSNFNNTTMIKRNITTNLTNITNCVEIKINNTAKLADTTNNIPNVTNSIKITSNIINSTILTYTTSMLTNTTKINTKTTNSIEILNLWSRRSKYKTNMNITRSTTPSFARSKQEESQEIRVKQDSDNSHNISVQLRRAIEDDWETDKDFMLPHIDGYDPHSTLPTQPGMDLDELPELDVGPPRNHEYNPNHGYELYWQNGSWVLQSKKPRYPDNTCGHMCLPMYKEYGVICARNRNYYYETFEDYCEMLSDDCEGQNGWVVVHPGVCGEVHDPANKTGFINQGELPWSMQEFTQLWNPDYRGE